jgi:hypothetical protein
MSVFYVQEYARRNADLRAGHKYRLPLHLSLDDLLTQLKHLTAEDLSGQTNLDSIEFTVITNYNVFHGGRQWV